MDSDEDESKDERMRRIHKCFFRDGSVEGREREVRKARVTKPKEERIQTDRQQE